MSKKKYRVIERNELNFVEDSESERKRVKTLFQELVDRVKDGAELNENEKNFFCFCAPMDFIAYDFPENIPICKDFLFKRKFLTYRNGLKEKNYQKPNRQKMLEIAARRAKGEIVDLEQAKVEVYEDIPQDEVKNDIIYLKQVYNGWNTELINQKQTNSLIKKVYRHTRQLLDKENGNAPEYTDNRIRLVLWSKYVHLMTKEEIESTTKAERIISLNGVSIEFDEESFYHIIYNHFASNTKTENSGKSFFTNRNIPPRKILDKIKEIVSKIDESGYYKNEDIRKVTINYQNEICRLWINVNTRKDDGKTRFNQVGSFYPVVDADDLKDLEDNYTPIKINDELSVYVRNWKRKLKDRLKKIKPIGFIMRKWNKIFKR